MGGLEVAGRPSGCPSVRFSEQYPVQTMRLSTQRRVEVLPPTRILNPWTSESEQEQTWCDQ